MKQHIFTGTTAPSSAPAGIGHHYVDTTAKKTYVSVGTATAADWKLDDGSNLIQNAINPGVTDKAPSQDAVYNALSSVGTQIPTEIAANLTVLSGFTLIRARTKIASGIKVVVQSGGVLKLI